MGVSDRQRKGSSKVAVIWTFTLLRLFFLRSSLWHVVLPSCSRLTHHSWLSVSSYSLLQTRHTHILLCHFLDNFLSSSTLTFSHLISSLDLTLSLSQIWHQWEDGLFFSSLIKRHRGDEVHRHQSETDRQAREWDDKVSVWSLLTLIPIHSFLRQWHPHHGVSTFITLTLTH